MAPQVLTLLCQTTTKQTAIQQEGEVCYDNDADDNDADDDIENDDKKKNNKTNNITT